MKKSDYHMKKSEYHMKNSGKHMKKSDNHMKKKNIFFSFRPFKCTSPLKNALIFCYLIDLIRLPIK